MKKQNTFRILLAMILIVILVVGLPMVAAKSGKGKEGDGDNNDDDDDRDEDDDKDDDDRDDDEDDREEDDDRDDDDRDDDDDSDDDSDSNSDSNDDSDDSSNDNSNDDNSDNSNDSSNDNSDSEISSSEAIDIARAVADGSLDRVEKDVEDGILVWKVRFEENDYRADIYVDAKSGDIIRKKIEDERNGRDIDIDERENDDNDDDRNFPDDDNQTNDNSNTQITRSEAIDIARTVAEGNLDRTELEFEDGVLVWKIRFFDNGDRYDIYVDAETGEIVRNRFRADDRDEDRDERNDNDNFEPISQEDLDNITNQQSTITIDQAIAIAQNQIAGQLRKVEQDIEDGSLVWKVRLDTPDQIADIRINAESGQVVRIELKENQSNSDFNIDNDFGDLTEREVSLLVRFIRWLNIFG